MVYKPKEPTEEAPVKVEFAKFSDLSKPSEEFKNLLKAFGEDETVMNSNAAAFVPEPEESKEPK